MSICPTALRTIESSYLLAACTHIATAKSAGSSPTFLETMLAAVRRSQPHLRLAAALSAGREAPDAHPGEAGAQPGTAGEACAATEQHWLDRRLPGAREWLEAKSRAWWLKGVELRCRCLLQPAYSLSHYKEAAC